MYINVIHTTPLYHQLLAALEKRSELLPTEYSAVQQEYIAWLLAYCFDLLIQIHSNYIMLACMLCNVYVHITS